MMGLAIASGVLGALAAAVGKLSLSASSPLLTLLTPLLCPPSHPPSSSSCDFVVSTTIRAAGFLLTLLLNMYMMKYFLAALTKSSHTSLATMIISAVNFAATVRI